MLRNLLIILALILGGIAPTYSEDNAPITAANYYLAYQYFDKISNYSNFIAEKVYQKDFANKKELAGINKLKVIEELTNVINGFVIAKYSERFNAAQMLTHGSCFKEVNLPAGPDCDELNNFLDNIKDQLSNLLTISVQEIKYNSSKYGLKQ